MNKTALWRWALRLGIVAIAIPLTWFMVVFTLEQTGHKDEALLVGWLTVLPLLILTPAAFVATLTLAVLALFTPRQLPTAKDPKPFNR